MGCGKLRAKEKSRVSSPDPAAVRATFTSVAPRYDLANHLLSGGVDFLWRQKLVKLASQGADQDILDLATGSGDVAFALRHGLPKDVRITGADFCEPMLARAREKRDRQGLPADGNQFVSGDCLALEFEDESFDLITIAFGLRNLADRRLGLTEILRVLKPGGRIIVLEFSQPYFWFRPFYYLYLKGVLPWLARWVTGDRDAYLYLGSSISEFPDRIGLVKELEDAGFSSVACEAYTFSIVALHIGYKKS
jgi:demethylmenaquinone methyltransferase / 2-methoxy-6-polyprenyl-1,4-benzoquinol methylase